MDIENLIKKYGSSENFIVYSASAGTGKTHTITKEEINYILQKGLSNFIAITFTNASAREMKERILEYLIEIAATKDIQKLSKDVRYNDILTTISASSKRMNWDVVEQNLLNILNNYSSLTISTIDSLSVRLLKAYQDKTELPMDIKILLDADEFYEELIIDSLIKDPEFSVKNEDEKINFFKSLVLSLSKNRINLNPLNQIGKDIDNINSILLKMNKETKLDSTLNFSIVENLIGELKEKLEKILGNEKEKEKLNSNTKNYLNKILDAIIKCRFNEIVTRDKNIQIVLGKYNSDKIINDILDIYTLAANVQILNIIKLHLNFSNAYTKIMKYYSTIKQYIYEIPLHFVYPELIRAINNKDELPIRFGKDINMFVIDEFQDTSIEQLKAISPFFDYIIDKGGKVFVVGDTKQAIYAFRGGDYKSLAKLIELKKEKTKTLNFNYRSKKEIIKFVGNLFPEEDQIEKVSKTLDFKNKVDDELYNAYCQAFRMSGAFNQNKIKAFKSEEGGYVEINVYGIDFPQIEPDKDNQDAFSGFELEDTLKDVYERIEDIKKRNYSYRDICIITAKNDDVRAIATYLNSIKNVPVKSYSSLDARERSISREIIALMKYSQNRENKISLYQFLKGSLLYNKVQNLNLVDEYNNLISKFENDPKNFSFDKNSKIYQTCFEEILKNAYTLSAYDMLSTIYRIFDVTSSTYNKEQAAYMALLDAAIRIEEEKDNTIKTYIDEFEQNGTENEFEESNIWKMKISDSIDAVTISTIHKMKGLEFPIVFYIKMRDKKNDYYDITLIKYDENYYLGKFSNENLAIIENTSLNINKEELKDFHKQQDIDFAVNNINPNYVAITRAIDELYIFLINGDRSKAGIKSIFTSLIYNFYKSNADLWKKDNDKDRIVLRFSTGKKCKNTRQIKQTETLINSFAIPEFKSIYLKSFLNRDEQARYGTAIHNVLSKIIFSGKEPINIQIEKAIEEVKKEGVDITDRFKIANDIKEILANSEMKWIFDEILGRVIKNEMEFVDENGNLYRADRVIFDKDCVYVIDYKTGRPSAEERREYISQVKNYTKIIEKLSGRKTEGRIFYIDSKEVEKI